MSGLSTTGIRSSTPKTYHFSPYTSTQFDHPKPKSPTQKYQPTRRLTYYPNIHSQGKTHRHRNDPFGGRYDVRASYSPEHVLHSSYTTSACSTATGLIKHEEKKGETLEELFLKAEVPRTDKMLVQLQREESKQWRWRNGVDAFLLHGSGKSSAEKGTWRSPGCIETVKGEHAAPSTLEAEIDTWA